MSTMEHVLMSIFDRKEAIKRQMGQQVDSYRQTMACNLAIDGACPPVWLWPAAARNAEAHPDLKELNREQLISDILFPHPLSTTSVANCNTVSSLPALTAEHVIQPDSFLTKMCATNKYLYAEEKGKTTNNVYQNSSPKDADMMVEPEVDSCGKIGTLARVTRSRSRQKDLESRLSTERRAADRLGEGSAADKNSDRITPKAASAGKEEAERISSRALDKQRPNLEEMQNSECHNLHILSNRPLSTPSSAIEATCPISQNVSLSSPCTGDRESNSFLNVNHDDSWKCSSERLAKYTIDDFSSDILANKLSSLACRRSGTNQFVDPTHLLPEDLQNNNLSKNSITALEKDSDESFSGIDSTDMETVQSLKQRYCRDSTALHVSLENEQLQVESTFLTAEIMRDMEEQVPVECEKQDSLTFDEKIGSVYFSNDASRNSISASSMCTVGTEKVLKEDSMYTAGTKEANRISSSPLGKQMSGLEENENSKCHFQSMSANMPLTTPSAIEETCWVSENMPILSSPMRDGEANSILNAKHDYCRKSSSEILAKYTVEDKLVNELSDVACTPSRASHAVEAADYLSEGLKIHNTGKNSVTSLGKDPDGSFSGIYSINTKTVQSVKQTSCRESTPVYVSSENEQLQVEDTFLTELVRDADDNISSGCKKQNNMFDQTTGLGYFSNGASRNSCFATPHITAGTEELLQEVNSLSNAGAEEVNKISSRLLDKQGPKLEESESSVCHSQSTSSKSPTSTPSSDIEAMCRISQNMSIDSSTMRNGEPNLILSANRDYFRESSCGRLTTMRTIEDHSSGQLVNGTSGIECQSSGVNRVESTRLSECLEIHNLSNKSVTSSSMLVNGPSDIGCQSSGANLVEVPRLSEGIEIHNSSKKSVTSGDMLVNGPSDVECQSSGANLVEVTRLSEGLGIHNSSNKSVTSSDKLVNGLSDVECQSSGANLVEVTSLSEGLEIHNSSNKSVTSSGKFVNGPSVIECQSSGANQVEATRLSEGLEIHNSSNKSVTSLRKDLDGSDSGIDSANMEILQSLKQLSCTESTAGYVSIENGQLQAEDTFPIAEIVGDAEETVFVGDEMENNVMFAESSDLVGSFLKGESQGMVAPFLLDHTQEDSYIDLAGPSPSACLMDTLNTNDCDTLKLNLHCTSEDGQDYMPDEDILDNSSPKPVYGDGDFTEDVMFDGDKSSGSSSHFDDVLVDCDDAMPEYEGFSIPVPLIMEGEVFCNDSDFTRLTKERASMVEELCKASTIFTPMSRASTKNRIYEVPEVYQSIPSGILEHTSLTKSFRYSDIGMKQFRASKGDRLSGLCSNLGLEFDGSFARRSFLDSNPSSSARSVWEAMKLPLTPPVEKFSQRMIPGRARSSPEVGSNPELTCFRIDENASTTDENGVPDELYTSGKIIGLKGMKDSAERPELGDVSPAYQNSPSMASVSKELLERGSPDSVRTELFYGTQVGSYSNFGEEHLKSMSNTVLVSDKVHDELYTPGMMTDLSGIEDSPETRTLADVSAAYHNSANMVSVSKELLEGGSVESVCKKPFCGTRTSSYSSLGKGPSKNKLKLQKKENHALSMSAKKRVPNAADFLHNRSSKPDISGTTSKKNRIEMDQVKGCKANNIVSNVSSFIPLVRQKQEAAAPAKGKKDIKVKALEAAEAAKCLEERKQEERDKRKAAVKLERERLEQEKMRRLELEQKKTKEEKRKRQREEGKKEEERKMRRTELTRKRHREQDDSRVHFEKAEKKQRHPPADEREGKKKEPGKAAQRQFKSEKGVPGCRKATESEQSTSTIVAEDVNYSFASLAPQHAYMFTNDAEKVAWNSGSCQETIRVGSSGFAELEGYEMSPFMDSDNDDGEEENRRKGKYIPPWARRENLNQTILAIKDLDPVAIFSRKRSFSLTEVLFLPHQRRPM